MNQWFYAEGNRQQRGPLASEELIALYQSSRIALDTLVWRDGMAQWQPLRSVADEIGLVIAPPAGEPTAPIPPRLPEFDTPAPRAAAPAAAAVPVPPPSYARAAPPPKKNSGCLIIGLVLGVGFLIVCAILAAIALPAYQDYVYRAKVANAEAVVSPLRMQVADFVMNHERCPVNGDEGFQSPTAYAADPVGAVRIGRFGEGRCGVEIEFATPGKPALDGKMLWFQYDMQRQEWSCSSDAESRYVPVHCRG